MPVLTPAARDGLRAALAQAAGALLPRDCAACGAADRELCPACGAALTAARPRRWQPATRGGAVNYLLEYEGGVARILHEYKEAGRTGLARPLGALLRRAVAEAVAEVGDPVLIVPVPSSRAAYRRRGWRPVELLLRRADVPACRALRVCRRVADQAGLGQLERAQNLRGAFRARMSLSGQRVLLVDDVVTTGATLREAARAVHAAGGRVLGAVALARTPRHAERRPERLRRA